MDSELGPSLDRLEHVGEEGISCTLHNSTLVLRALNIDELALTVGDF